MEIKKITKTIEEVVATQYIAADGTVFNNENECKTYEESALFVVKTKLKLIASGRNDILLSSGSDELVEIFDIQTQSDLDNLRQYLYLTLCAHNARPTDFNDCFVCTNENRRDFTFDNVTVGHPVIIFWSYDQDWFWVYRDGSFDGYLDYLRDKYDAFISQGDKGDSNE